MQTEASRLLQHMSCSLAKGSQAKACNRQLSKPLSSSMLAIEIQYHVTISTSKKGLAMRSPTRCHEPRQLRAARLPARDAYKQNALNGNLRRAKWQSAMQLLRWAGSLQSQLNIVAYTTGIRSLRISSRWRVGSSLLDFLRTFGLRFDTICVGTVLSTCDGWRTALLYAELLEMSGMHTGTVICGQLTAAYMRQTKWEHASLLVSSLSTTQSTPDSQTCTSNIQACSGEWRTASQIMADMAILRIFVDDIARKAAMNSLTEAGLWQKTLQALGSLEDLDHMSCSSCQTACTKKATWAVPLGLLTTAVLFQASLDLIAFSTTIAACDKGGSWARAASLLGEVSKAKLQTDIVCWDGSIPSCEPVWRLAFCMIAEMRHNSLTARTTSFNRCVNACQRCNEWRFAHHLLWSGLERDVVSYNLVLLALRLPSQWQSAQQTCQQMVDAQLHVARGRCILLTMSRSGISLTLVMPQRE